MTHTSALSSVITKSFLLVCFVQFIYISIITLVYETLTQCVIQNTGKTHLYEHGTFHISVLSSP